jgi:hypothetical protein
MKNHLVSLEQMNHFNFKKLFDILFEIFYLYVAPFVTYNYHYLLFKLWNL